MLPQTVSSQRAFESTVGPFAVKSRNNSMFSFMSIKIVPQSKALTAIPTAIWPRMGFAMAAAIETVSQGNVSKRTERYTCIFLV
jgi:hypothetical protein